MSVLILMKVLGGLLAAVEVFSLILTANLVVGEASPPTPASAFQTPPAPEPTPGINDRLYVVEIGPFSSRDGAAAVAKELSAGGFSQTKIANQTRFRVVSEPLPRSVAEGLVATLAGRGFHSQIEPLSGDTVQLLFATFTTQSEADALAQRIGAAGYDAWVRGGTGYVLQLGPYPQSAVDTIVGIIKSRAPHATVAADPVASQAPAPVSAPQVSPPPAGPAPQIVAAPPQPSPVISDRLYVVEIGPFSSRDGAAAVAKELSAGGFSQTKIANQTRFRVVSEPLPRSVAEGLVATLAGRGFHSQIEPLSGDTVQLLLGAFTTQGEADALAQRIGAAGYDAWVRGGTGYMLQLGPYPQSAVNTIVGIIKSRAPDATVAADPVASHAPPPVSAPQASPPPPASAAPTTPKGPQAPTGASSPPTASEPSRPAVQAPSPAASSGLSQAASWGLSQGAVVAPPRFVRSAASPAIEAAPFLIIPAQSLGTVRLGAPVQDETARLGASKGYAKFDDGTMMYWWLEPPSNSGIGVRTAQNGMVLRVWVLNDERYRTKEGLHIGSSEAEVRAVLGNPTLIDINVERRTRTLVYESLGLWFSIQLDQRYRYYNAVFDIGIMAKK